VSSIGEWGRESGPSVVAKEPPEDESPATEHKLNGPFEEILELLGQKNVK
jgi:hypothetical protein